MEILSDILLGAGAIGAAAYCLVLARRLRNLTRLEGGMGAAIAVLSAQVDDLTKALAAARNTSAGAVATLEERTQRAEAAAARIELLIASLHDLPEPGSHPEGIQQPAPQAERQRRQVLRTRPRERGRDDDNQTPIGGTDHEAAA